MKIAILGNGKMGSMVKELAPKMGHTLVDSSFAEVFIDFSHPSKVLSHIQLAIDSQCPLIIGTTGWEEHLERGKKLVSESTIAALFSPNFSLGVQLFHLLLQKARALFKNYEAAGVEFHHSGKIDAPSGTAKSMARTLGLKRDFASVRCGRIAGRHEVLFDSADDTITLTHEAHGRESFARGALEAAQWILNKKGWYTIDDMLRCLYSADHPL